MDGLLILLFGYCHSYKTKRFMNNQNLADNKKRKQVKNKADKGYFFELRQNKIACKEHRKVKIKELKEAIKDPEYINKAIDCLADKMATAWLIEKYGEKKDEI